MIIREDFEIGNSKEDRLGLGKDVDIFINKYIESNYKGSVLLSGKWGIGKTSYLKQIEEKTNKDKTFVWLDYWDKNNQTKFYTYLYSKLKPNMYAWHKFNPLLWVIILSVVQFLLILFQFLISIFKDMQHLLDNSMIIMGLITWFILFVVSGTLTFAKDNYSEENKYKKKIVKYLKKHDVILIFDDFDRIDNESKNDLFHHLSEVNLFKKSLIIVVGEHNTLIESIDNVFTQKILNNVERMPLKTNSMSIWSYYVEKEIEKLIDSSNRTRSDDFLFSDIRELFIADHRTFREAKQLLNSFEFEYVEIREKKINPSQALAINYIYQFYNQIYEIINNNLDVIYGDDIRLEGSYDHRKIKGNIEKLLEESNIELPKVITNFIYKIFHNNNDTGFYYPSITERLNYTQYQLGHFETSSVSVETLNNYIQANLNDSSVVLDKLTEKDFERFFTLLNNRIRDENLDKQEYLSLLNKFIYYKFHGEYSDKNLTFTINYIDNLIYNVKNELNLIHSFSNDYQYREVVLHNDKIDISQKLELLAVFIPNNSGEEKINLVKEIIQDFSWEDLINMSKPILVYYFYTVYYKKLKNYTDIENELYKVLELEDIKFFEFIYEKLVNHITITTHKKVEYRRELRVNDLCFNENFKEDFLNKIYKLDDEKQNIIQNILIK